MCCFMHIMVTLLDSSEIQHYNYCFDFVRYWQVGDPYMMPPFHGHGQGIISFFATLHLGHFLSCRLIAVATYESWQRTT